jgi:hypothetical protein
MISNAFIEKSMWRATYVLSPYTSASYYAEALEGNFQFSDRSEREKAMKKSVQEQVESSEEWLLPHRINILRGESMASTKSSGRARNRFDAQLKSAFTKIEKSPYKQFKPYEVQTGLRKAEGTQSYYYGSLGVTGINGRVDRDNGDLLVIRTSDWNRLELFVFKGLAGRDKQLDYLPEVMSFVKSL